MAIREKIREVIFRHDTVSSQAFDIALLILIALSVIAVMLESVEGINSKFATELFYLEWTLTIIFSIEYILRIYTTFPKSWNYITSFYGIIDLLSILPSYIALFFVNSQYFLTVRALRLLRVFRIFKLTQFFGEMDVLVRALNASRFKISVFLLTVVLFSIILGSIMYVVEGAFVDTPDNKFTSIPQSIYWTIVTMTTVGYGDISPQSDFGRFIASIVMLLGYGIIAVPTGIVSVELAEAQKESITTVCDQCGEENHLQESLYCHRCAGKLKK